MTPIWMLLNKPDLKKDKTVLLVISSQLHRDRPALSHIHVCDDRVLASPTGGKVGVLLNKSLSMPGSSRVTAMSTDPLRKNRLIRKHLIFDAAQLLVQALVTSKLD